MMPWKNIFLGVLTTLVLLSFFWPIIACRYKWGEFREFRKSDDRRPSDIR